MFNTSKNPQVIYSLQHMSTSLLNLLENNSFDKITVGMITENAGLTRKTFYRNCESKMDLIDYAVAIRLHALLESIDINSADVEGLFRNFFEYWKTEAAVLKTLQDNGLFYRVNTVFMEYGVKGLTYDYLEKMLQNRTNPDTIKKYNSAYSLNGLAGVLYVWTASDFSDDISHLVYVMKSLAPLQSH